MEASMTSALGFEPHPAASLFPLMGRVELDGLAADIKANGLKHSIVMLDGKVLDGRNRLAACELAGVKPQLVEWTGTSSPTAFVLSQNLHRRHLSDTQCKLIAAAASKRYEEEARERQGKRTDLSADLRGSEFGKATQKAARDLGVSARGVEQARRVAEKAPVLLEMVRTGGASLDAAAVLADEPETRQRALAAAGPKAIREAANAKRSKSKAARAARSAPAASATNDHVILPERVRVYIERTTTASKLEDPRHVRALLRLAIECLNAKEKDARKLSSEYEEQLIKYTV